MVIARGLDIFANRARSDMHEPPKLKRPFAELPPVAWGFSRNFLEGLGRTLFFDLFPDRMDPRDWMGASRLAFHPNGEETEFWFDYLADTGDSQRATYSLFYMLHGALFVEGGELLTAPVPELGEGGKSLAFDERPGLTRLPSGPLVFFGGDAGYSLADQRTLEERLQVPSDLARHARHDATAPAPRVLCGIPGNHDWYDSLDGFGRLFRKPPASANKPSIPLEGLSPGQDASYVAIELPFGWKLWGIDPRDGGKVDFRQARYFAEIGSIPERLILCTPKPLIVHGARRPWVTDLLHDVGLEFEPQPGSARVYLSGDSHHYARYEFPGGVSLVQGLGGASLHPPQHRSAGISLASAPYPRPTEATRVIRGRLLNPLHMIFESGFGGIGAILGGLVGGALAAYEGELSSLLSRMGWLDLGVGTPSSRAPRVFAAACLLATVAALLVKAAGMLRKTRARQRRQGQPRPKPYFSKQVRALVTIVGLVLAIASALCAATWLGGGRSAPSSILDLLADLTLVALGPGLGLLARAQADNAWTFSSIRSAAVVVLGSSFGIVMVCALVLVSSICLGSLAKLPLVHALFADSLAPSSAGALAYTLTTLVGIACGALSGVLILPTLFGLATYVQYALGAQYTFAGSLCRIDDFVSFVRFRLRAHADGTSDLTGFTVAARSVEKGALRSGRRPPPVDARLIDVFVVKGRST
jgi:MFS family permease